MTASWLATLGSLSILSVAVLAPRESAAQMHGIPGAPPSRMGGVISSGAPRPMAGSSVPMMGRQGPVRPGQSVSAAPQGSRYSGRFRSSNYTGQYTSGARAFTGTRTSEAVKAQAKSASRGGFGF